MSDDTASWFEGIREHFGHTRQELAAIRAAQAALDTKLDLVLVTLKEFQMSATNSLANLQAAVANETTVTQSVLTLLTTLAAEIAAASPTGDNPAIDAVVTTMQANATALAAALAANPPGPPVGPITNPGT